MTDESDKKKIDETIDLSGQIDAASEKTTHPSPSDSHLQDTFDHKSDEPAAPTTPPTQTSPPKEFGRYSVERILGEGGFGSVYLGFDDELGRKVAIKVARRRSSPQEVETFKQEARRMAQLKHPGIVTVYDVGVHDGQCYIVCDYLEGEDLDDWLRGHRPDWQTSARIIAEIADALAHAHLQSIIHRDIKANNVILVDGKPVLVDFGLALSEAEAAESQRGLIAGTPHYMSPEQIKGRAHRIDGRTDIYSLGVMFYRMLTQRLPFTSKETKELFRQIREDLPQPPRQRVPEIPRNIEDICLKALEKDINRRYRTAGDLAEDLRLATGTMSPSQLFTGQSVMDDTQPLEAESLEKSMGESYPAIPTAELPSEIRRAREAERRQLTVLFCGCELLDEDEELDLLDPEDQHELVVEFQKVCESVTQQFDGTPVPTSDDEQLICFGYPIGYEDAAQRAVRTGLGIVAGVQKLNEQLKERKQHELTPWIVIHTGQVVVGESSDTGDDISLVGEGRNVATKMENVAENGKVVISSATHNLVKAFFVCASLGETKIKGIGKLESFEVAGESEAATKLDAVDESRLTPLVGRDQEVALLRGRWEDAAEGDGQVVLLVGDAGLGKSRLVHVIRAHVIEETDDDDLQPLLEWRCSSNFSNTGLYPAISFFERRLGYSREDSADEKLSKLEQYLDDYQFNDASEAVALLAAMLSIPLSDQYSLPEVTPQRRKELTLEVLMEWLREHASKQPVLFVVEDLHWVDPSTLEFLAMVTEQGANEPIMMLFTFRPGFEVPWGNPAHQTQVPLNKLRKKQITEFMQLQTGMKEIPPHVLDQIIDRTDGVPLFIEEFTNMLQDTGGLKELDGNVTMTSSFSLEAIPSTLQDLLIARLDRMEADREVAQLGATLGREFTFELINAVAELDDEALLKELGLLAGAEVLLQRGRPPKCTYQFKHALIQDAAYQSLLKKKRLSFHEKIADVLEQQFPETAKTAPELLAHHFTEASVVDKGLSYWAQAGQRSQQRSANTEAIIQLSKGLEIVRTLDESPERDQTELGFLVPLGVVYMATLGWASEEVGVTFRRAREICETLGAGEHQFNVMWGLWAWHLLRGEFDTCMELADETTKLADGIAHPAILMEAPWIPGCTQFYRGDFKAAIENYELGMSRWDEEMSKATAFATGQNCGVTYQCYHAISLWYLGFPDQALVKMDEALALAVKLKHPFSRAFTMWHKSWLYSLRREGKETQETAEKAFKLAVDQSFQLWKFLSLVTQGQGRFLQGDFENAIEPIGQGMGATLDVLGSKLNLPHCQHVMAEAKLQLNQIDEALEHLDIELKHAQASNELFTLAEVHRLRGEMLLAKSTDNTAQAESCFRESLAVAQQQEAKSWELRAATSLARLLQSQGNSDEAESTLEPIYNWFTEGFETQDLIDAKTLLDSLA